MKAQVRRWLRQQNSHEFRGFRLVHDRDAAQLWEVRHLQRLLPLLRVDCVFDVGANRGQYARMLRSRVGFEGRIISFEPVPEAAHAARQLMASDPLWHLEERALGPGQTRGQFRVMTGEQFSSFGMPRNEEMPSLVHLNRVERTIEVTVESLDGAFNRLASQHGITRPFLKLDTQGFDTQVVQSGSRVMRRFVGMQSELAVRRLYDVSVDYRDALRLYQELGFSLSALVPNNAGHFPRLAEIDAILFRESAL